MDLKVPLVSLRAAAYTEKKNAHRINANVLGRFSAETDKDMGAVPMYQFSAAVALMFNEAEMVSSY